MRIQLPGYENRSVWEFHQQVGTASGTISVHSLVFDADGLHRIFWDGDTPPSSNLVYAHEVSFGEGGSKLGEHANFRIAFNKPEDLFAIESLLNELLRLKPLIESGEIAPEEGHIDLHHKGSTYAFTLRLATGSDVLVRNPDTGLLELGRQEMSPNANGFSVSVISGTEEIGIGFFEFYGGLESALLIAHDFAVLRALIEGKPEHEILQMVPVEINDAASDSLDLIFEKQMTWLD